MILLFLGSLTHVRDGWTYKHNDNDRFCGPPKVTVSVCIIDVVIPIP